MVCAGKPLDDLSASVLSTVPSLPKSVLAQRVVDALGQDLVSHGDVEEVPFRIEVQGLLPLAIWGGERRRMVVIDEYGR